MRLLLACADTIAIEAAVTEGLIFIKLDVVQGLGLQIDQAHAKSIDNKNERIRLEIERSVRSHMVANVLRLKLRNTVFDESVVIIQSLRLLVCSPVLHHLNLI